VNSREALVFLGPACAFLSSFTWAFGSARYSQLSVKYTPFAVNFSRALVAFPLFLIATVAMNGFSGAIQSFGSVTLSQVLLLFVAMIGSYGFGDVLFLWSTRSLGVPAALAIASTFPIWTTLSGVVFRGDRLPVQAFIGMLLAIFGVVIVIISGKKREPIGIARSASKNERNFGVIFACLASFMWATHSLIVSSVSPAHSPTVVNAIRMATAMVISFVIGRIMARNQSFLLPRSVMISSLWLFAYEAFGGSLFYVVGMSHSPLVVAATLSSLAPVMAVPISWLAKIEKPSLSSTAGIVTVVVGIWLLVIV
jgi:drug/metabolite transporter (DMT)-like permease